MARWSVCPAPSCSTLINRSNPCPVHSRPRNAPWSKDRDRQAQHHFRLAVLDRDFYRCVSCGHYDPTGRTLEAHHDRPGNDVSDGRTLCTGPDGCHRKADRNAR